MSNITLKGNASGSGTTTLQSPNTNASLTLTFPAADGTSGQAILTDGSGNLTFGNAGINTGKSIAMAMIFGF
jgi:glycine cleavage system aminomethyltransferase T